MAGNKTRDGIKISKLLKFLGNIDSVEIRPGNNHPFVARSSENTLSCPIASSTDARRMVVPWIAETIGYHNSNAIYNALRSGSWPPVGYAV
jgi:hypothetical protein